MLRTKILNNYNTFANCETTLVNNNKNNKRSKNTFSLLKVVKIFRSAVSLTVGYLITS